MAIDESTVWFSDETAWKKRFFLGKKRFFRKKNFAKREKSRLFLALLCKCPLWPSSNEELTTADVIQPYFITKLRFSVIILRVILNFLKTAYDK